MLSGDDPQGRLPAADDDAGAASAAGDDSAGAASAAGEPRSAAAEMLLGGLNEPQREAVTHFEGPLLILAGAGSGKTRVLAHRVAYLIRVRRVRPDEVLAITFTNKAAAEMRGRIGALVGPMARVMWISTFHSMCARILRREAERLGYKSTFSIYDADDAKRLVKRCLAELDLDDKRFTPDALARAISDAKNRLQDPAAFREITGGFFQRAAADVYELYEKKLMEMSAMDFDDLLMKTVNLLEIYPDRLQHYQRTFRFVMVDEYQDTNHAQYRIANLLAGASGNLAVVGDDDQSIYSWRGADIRNILEFERDHPDAKVIRLEQNYRSTTRILDVANAVVSNNRRRKGKNLWTARGTGRPAHVVEVGDEHAEARYIASEVRKLLDEGVVSEGAAQDGPLAPHDIAVLYRTNAQSRVLEEEFGRYAIAYQVVGGTRFYERAEVKDALAYLAIINNPADEQRLLRIVNTPRRGLGPTAIGRLQTEAQSLGDSLWSVIERAADLPGLTAAAASSLHPFRRRGRHLARRGADHDVGGRARAPRARRERLLGHAPGPGHARGRGSHREPRGARGRGRRVRPARREPDPRRLSAGDLALLGHRHHGRHERAHHLHDAAQRQGPRVSGRLHHRPRGGRVPPPALARRPEPRRGAPPGLRGHHARHGPPVPAARPPAQPVGRQPVRAALALSDRDPGRPGRGHAGRRAVVRRRRLAGRRRPGRPGRPVAAAAVATGTTARTGGSATTTCRWGRGDASPASRRRTATRWSSCSSPPATGCCTPPWARAR